MQWFGIKSYTKNMNINGNTKSREKNKNLVVFQKRRRRLECWTPEELCINKENWARHCHVSFSSVLFSQGLGLVDPSLWQDLIQQISSDKSCSEPSLPTFAVPIRVHFWTKMPIATRYLENFVALGDTLNVNIVFLNISCPHHVYTLRAFAMGVGRPIGPSFSTRWAKELSPRRGEMFRGCTLRKL